MKRFLLFYGFLFLTTLSFSQKGDNQEKTSKPKTTSNAFNPNLLPEIDSGFRVTARLKGYTAGVAYLCYHFGKNLNIADSSVMGENEVVVFDGGKPLPGGIYSIVFPGKRYLFDFFINKSQVINIVADSSDLSNVQVVGEPENQLFQDYQRFVSVKGTILSQERTAYSLSTNREDSLRHQANFDKANKELIAYRNEIIQNQPNSMMAMMLKTMYEPEILIKNPKTRQDTIDNYQYYRKHYWDGVTFMDERVIRTPFFIPKFERYYRDVLPQVPDTLIQDIDYRLLFARNNNEVFKFMLNWFTDEYLNPKIMGHDAIYVHLFEKYHSKGLSPWLNEKQMKTVTDRAYMVMSNLIGAPAPPLDMLNTDGKMRPLLDEKASYILVVFWDPTCGHCKEEIPRIDSIYRASWKRRGVKIYSVLSDNTKENEWRKYLIEHNLKDWINVYETKAMEEQVNMEKRPSFRQLYDVIQTPTIMLLDKDKKIIGKKLGITQINELLETRWRKEK